MYVCGTGFGLMYFFAYFLALFCRIFFLNFDRKPLQHLIAAAVLIAFTAYMAHLTTAVARLLPIWAVA